MFRLVVGGYGLFGVIVTVIVWEIVTVVKWVVTIVCQIVTVVVGTVVTWVLQVVGWFVSFVVCVFTDPVAAILSIRDPASCYRHIPLPSFAARWRGKDFEDRLIQLSIMFVNRAGKHHHFR